MQREGRQWRGGLAMATNLVERFFADLAAQVVREGSFGSVRKLTGALEAYLAERDLAPKPYRRRAQGAEILAKIQRASSPSTLPLHRPRPS